jgi:hypothetical protein
MDLDFEPETEIEDLCRREFLDEGVDAAIHAVDSWVRELQRFILAVEAALLALSKFLTLSG